MTGRLAPLLVRTASHVAAITLDPGDTEVRVHDDRITGAWRFHAESPAELRIDFLGSDLVTVGGGVSLQRAQCEGFVATPRLRVSVNDVTYDVVSTDEGVLARNYSRPDHQSLYKADRWGEAFHAGRLRQCRRLLAGVTGSVCDVGSGYSMVRSTGPWPFTLHAFDRDPSAVRALREAGIDAREAPADEPPFDDDHFDAVYAGEIVEHLPHPHEALRRWVRLLKPGGRLIVTTPNRRHLLTRARRHEVVENPEHLFEWDLDELRRAVAGAGAHIDRVEGLILPIPVYIPRRGWRDFTPTLVSHVDGVPSRVMRAMVELGRLAPALAYNLAVAAHRVR